MTGRRAWIDASAGIAGDMLLAALVDAGAVLSELQAAVDAVLPGAVRLGVQPVTRAGQRALLLDVDVIAADPPERTWADLRRLLEAADLPDRVARRAHATFAALAEAEAAVHGIPVEQVHFHEVGALDSVADVVGVAAALESLDVAVLSAGPVAVGSGRIRTAHGDLAVPVPAVVRLAVGWDVVAGGTGELATPTGMALVRTLAERSEPLPALRLECAGAGAGRADPPGRANLTRVLIGTPTRAEQPADRVALLEANIDDLDPRLWPGVLADLLAAGALDAWLVPVLMKKGRPAHTLAVLARPESTTAIGDVLLDRTSSIGWRRTDLTRTALPRGWLDVPLADGAVAVKVSHRDGVVWQATPEFDAVEAYARRTGRSTADVLADAASAAAAAGLVRGAAVPDGLRAVPAADPAGA